MFVACALAAIMLLGLGLAITADTWFVIAAGRVVADGGPPSTDTLTSWTLGRQWIDQQWLGQLALYEIWRLGDMVLLGFVHVAIVTTTFVLALVGARLRGGSPRHVAAIGLLAALPIVVVTGNVRTQTLALPLFLLVLLLLVNDNRSPSRLVYLCIPLLVVWANVHGSVLVGAALVALAAGIDALHDLRRRQLRRVGRPAILLAAVPLALLATPYGTSTFSYFSDIIGNAEVGKIASDWMAPTISSIHVPFYLLAGVTLAVVARDVRRLTMFEGLILVLLLAGALTAQRNLAWFTLAAVLLVPSALTGARGSPVGRPPPVGLAATASMLAAAAVAYAAVHGVITADRHINAKYPPEAAAIVAREASADPSMRVFADLTYANWLLVRHRSLEGRISFDIRYELLTPAEIRRIRRVRDQIGVNWLAAAGNARLFVLDSSKKPLGVLPSTASVLLREPGSRRLYAGRDIVVILRSARAPATG